MQLETYLSPDLVLILDDVATIEALVHRLAEVAATQFRDLDAARIEAALQEREQQAPTSTPEGVGFPHALLPQVDHTVVVVARAPAGVPTSAAKHPPVDLVFCMVGGAEEPWRHVRLLARIARIARGSGALERLRKADTPEALYEALVQEDRSHV